MKRRSFLTAVTMGAGAGAAITARGAADSRSDQPGVVKPPTDAEPVAGMPRRQLGTTGKYLSIIGYAGFALRDKERSQAECTASLSKALENGINYFDVAPAYDDGLCEIRMGQAATTLVVPLIRNPGGHRSGVPVHIGTSGGRVRHSPRVPRPGRTRLASGPQLPAAG